jgi:two-component system sensor histidine kinase TtrS
VAALAEITSDRLASVTIDLPPALPIVCDGHKMKGVLVNLVKNAVESGRNVRVKGWIEAAPGGRRIVIEVSDDGPGLSPEARLHLFEPFFTTKPNGTGLGLPTSLRYIEAHGGELSAEPRPPGAGAVFRVILPAPEPVPAPADATATTTTATATTTDWSGA